MKRVNFLISEGKGEGFTIVAAAVWKEEVLMTNPNQTKRGEGVYDYKGEPKPLMGFCAHPVNMVAKGPISFGNIISLSF